MTSNSKFDERAFLLEFLEVYKSLPALWDVRSPDYRNKIVKTESYELLLAKYKERYPTATREDVTKKINSLRTNFRKEVKRLREARRFSGASDTLLEPTLWYFDEMCFLLDHDLVNFNSSMESVEGQEESFSCVSETENEGYLLPPPKRKKEAPAQEEVFRLVRQHLQTAESSSMQIAKVWAMELDKLTPDQQIHAKKAINDILYEGQFGNLHRNCIQILPPPSTTPVCSQSTCAASLNETTRDINVESN